MQAITHECTSTCRRIEIKPQLPKEHVTPDSIFDSVGIDYAGPVIIC